MTDNILEFEEQFENKQNYPKKRVSTDDQDQEFVLI